jgi:hypothetical protein
VARLNLRDMIEDVGPEAERLFKARAGFDVPDVEVPLELWVGADGRPARVTMKTNVNGYKMRFAADILEFGPKVAADG